MYEMNKDGSGYRILLNFGAGESDGTSPISGLSVSSDPTFLFGTTALGGAGGGIVFSYRPD
jgi:hypothetical protein